MYSPSEKLCPETASLSDWNQMRRHLIEIHQSVLHNNISKHFRKRHQFPKLHAGEFEFVECDDERPALNDRLFPILDGTPNQVIKNIKEASCARKTDLRHIPQKIATALSTICDIFGVATDAGLVIVDLGATRRSSLFSRRFRKSCLAQRWTSSWKQDEQ